MVGPADPRMDSFDDARSGFVFSPPSFQDFAAPVIPPDPEDCLRGIARGVGQVFLADSVGAAIFIFIGLAICSRITAMSALLGSALGFCMALATGTAAST